MENSSRISLLVVDVLKFMGECGARYHVDDFEDIFMYVYKMLNDGRIAEVIGKDGIDGYIFYSICNNIELYYKKKTWAYVPQEEDGTICYAEKIVVKKWNKEIRAKFEELITSRHPKAVSGVWHRYGKTGDRQVICYRRKTCTK